MKQGQVTSSIAFHSSSLRPNEMVHFKQPGERYVCFKFMSEAENHRKILEEKPQFALKKVK